MCSWLVEACRQAAAYVGLTIVRNHLVGSVRLSHAGIHTSGAHVGCCFMLPLFFWFAMPFLSQACTHSRSIPSRAQTPLAHFAWMAISKSPPPLPRLCLSFFFRYSVGISCAWRCRRASLAGTSSRCAVARRVADVRTPLQSLVRCALFMLASLPPGEHKTKRGARPDS